MLYQKNVPSVMIAGEIKKMPQSLELSEILQMLVSAINRHWKFINEQITKTFNGEKTIAIDIEK